jgi:hypothetical protein
MPVLKDAYADSDRHPPRLEVPSDGPILCRSTREAGAPGLSSRRPHLANSAAWVGDGDAAAQSDAASPRRRSMRRGWFSGTSRSAEPTRSTCAFASQGSCHQSSEGRRPRKGLAAPADAAP